MITKRALAGIDVFLYAKWRSNAFERQTLKVFKKQALIFQKPAGGGLWPP
jgi:hypothetical protein